MAKPVHVGAIVSAPWVGGFFWTFVASCLRTESLRQNVTLTKHAALTVEEQSAQLCQLLDIGVQAIVMKPMCDADSVLRTALDRANAAGVPIVTLDSLLDHRAVIATVGTDNASAMAEAVRFAFEQIKGTGQVAYFAGDDRLPAGAARNKSFHEVLRAHSGIQLMHEAQLDWVKPMPMSRRAFGAECMREVLMSTQRIDALISASDEAALGALDHIRAVGLDVPVIVGFDGVPEALLEISTGGMTGTVQQAAEAIARNAVELLLKAIRGEPVDRVVRVATTLITKENAEKAALRSLQLVPRLVFDLSESHLAQRDLQQQIISKQQKILSAVAAASDALSRIRERDHMAREFVTVLVKHFGLASARVVPAGSIGEKEPARPVSTDSPGAGFPVSANEGLQRQYDACMKGRCATVVTDDASLRRINVPGGPSVDAVLLLPLYVAEKSIGLLDLRAEHARAFDAESVEILVALAHQLAIAFENASLYEETVRLAQSELRETHEKLAHAQRAEHLSNHDALTDLPNRRLFNSLLAQALLQAKRYDRELAVLFLDLDRFKLVNDTMGHEAGDQLLKEAAIRLRACLRESDTVARLGGDEFVILLPELTGASHLSTVARKILSVIGKPFSLGANEFKVTASIGVSLFPHDGIDGATLTKNADIAMYQAKRQGKNNFQYYSEQINAHSLQRLSLEAGLRRALAQGEFRLHYQPKRDTATELITGLEALLRWQHPELGLVGPIDFLPVAEEMGLSVPIGKWVLQTACRQNVLWQQLGLPEMVVSVNLTPKQLMNEGLVKDIEEILGETGMRACCLELEFAERTLMHDADRCMDVLAALKQCGVRLAVDDFGAGYSSLSALKRFPLDTVKIDRSFIRGVATDDADDTDTSVAQAIIAMGRTLSLTVVAQGVETRQQVDFLRAHACDECQGFYFNAAIAPGDLTALLKKQAGPATPA